jgi:hypothetical protein
MSTDKPEDQITEAGAVELDEGQLDNASGGIIAVAPAPIPSPEVKLNPELKFNPEFKFRG